MTVVLGGLAGGVMQRLDKTWPVHQKPKVGVGLKSQHYDYVLENKPELDFFEVHAENYMMKGGAHHRYLEKIASSYALSIHGVGMSLGSAVGLDAAHLTRFKDLVERYEPCLVSEHLAWSVSDGTYLNDLLPLPLTPESLKIVSDNVKRMQDAIGRQILIENPSSYLSFSESIIPEPDFLASLVEECACGILLDVNNIYVSSQNLHADCDTYWQNLPIDAIGEVHLAGHVVKDIEGVTLRIDDHGSAVCDAVWALFEKLPHEAGHKPTLVEWDCNIPEFPVLLSEANKARKLMEQAEAIHV